MNLNLYTDLTALTPLNPFDRFPDGRPKVPDELLERMREVTVEEAWHVLKENGYHHQHTASWHVLHPNQTLVGRAVTAAYMPTRPDLHQIVEDWGHAEGSIGLHNSFAIDKLVEGDVLVVDMLGKVKDGTFAGDNLGTAIANKTKRGTVIDGGVRDVIRMGQIPNLQVFHRGVDASAIKDVTLTSLNGPLHVGGATCLPGDVVLGSISGVIFIPPHMAQLVVEESERIRLEDFWGQMRINEGKYTSGQVDGFWTDEMHADFKNWYTDWVEAGRPKLV